MQIWVQLQKKSEKRDGFTLAEMLVVLCLLAVLSCFLMQCFVFVMDQYRNRVALLELEENLSVSMDLIARDLADCTGVSKCAADSLTVICRNGVIEYTTGTDTQSKDHLYDLKGKILYRKENTQRNRQPVANFISRLCINYYDGAGACTTDAAKVHLVEVQLEGAWKDKTIVQRQIAKIQDSEYY